MGTTDSAIPARTDIVDAVFQRSFDHLSSSGKTVFLCVGNSKSSLTEVTLVVVLGLRDFDVTSGIDECRRLSLISEDALRDGQSCYSAPHLARVFARKKLESHPDRIQVEEDLQLLAKFGFVDPSQPGARTLEDQIKPFLRWCLEAVRKKDHPGTARLDEHLETLSELWAPGWLMLAEFRKANGSDGARVEQALRRAVEEMPGSVDAWMARANWAGQRGDDGTRIAALVSCADAAPGDVKLVAYVAVEICKYVYEHRVEIPTGRRGAYLASVRAHMVRLADKLDATGLSRLAWLFLFEGNERDAGRYAELGLKKDLTNEHCIRIRNRLGQGSEDSKVIWNDRE